MNEDRVATGQGFGRHPHEDMEIVSYVLAGTLEHKDSLMGNGAVLHPGEFQRNAAGTGITHSKFNPSKDQPTHFYQIWLLPERSRLAPSYEQKRFDDNRMNDQLRHQTVARVRSQSTRMCKSICRSSLQTNRSSFVFLFLWRFFEFRFRRMEWS